VNLLYILIGTTLAEEMLKRMVLETVSRYDVFISKPWKETQYLIQKTLKLCSFLIFNYSALYKFTIVFSK
jgi:hypothetical protein